MTLDDGWTENINTDFFRLKYFTGFSNIAVQLWSQACLVENIYLDAIWLKTWEFEADGGREEIRRFLVVEDTMDTVLGKITRAA